MKVLHAINYHRLGGGSDNVGANTLRLSRESGLDIRVFEKKSTDISTGLDGRLQAFCSGIYSRQSIREFRKIIAEFNPDVVHSHELYPLISPWILPECSRVGIPIVHSCYDYRLTCPVATHFSRGEICLKCMTSGVHWAILKNCRNNLAESTGFALRSCIAKNFRLYSRHVDHFLVFSEFQRGWLIDHVGVDPDRISVSPCTIPVSDADVDAANGLYAGYAGRFTQEKGIDLVIEAARIAGIPLKLAGNAATETPMDLDDGMECVMTRSPQELSEFYRSSRFLVVPSIWWESFGVVAAEAMSHGVPVIASKVGALENIVIDGRTGLLFEMGNAVDLAEKMTLLWNNPELCRRMGIAAREKVRDSYNEENHMAAIVEAYTKVLQRHT